MFTLWGRQHRNCDGIGRREFLRLGGLGLGTLTLADLLQADELPANKGKRPKSVIYVVLSGGISHIDTWDPKPEAPVEYRGEFTTIPTKLPGVRFCDLFPKQASIMDRLAILRGVQSVENDHFLSEVYSGLPRTSGKRPAFGSIVSKLATSQSPLPPYVCLNEATTDQFEFEKPQYVGAGHGPFRPFGDALENLSPVKLADRLEDRRGLLAKMNEFRRGLDKSDAFAGLDRFQSQALQMITSPQVRAAFDLSKESPQTIERYGRGKYTHQTVKHLIYDWEAKRFLMARRLVEAGVRVVTLQCGSWDHHSSPDQHIFESYKLCLPALDHSIHALVTDLEERGLSEDVLVVVLSEFGRTPKLGYPGPGREHWADAGCALFAGGGLKMGQVIGETDTRAEKSTSVRITFQNIMATIYRVLGIDPTIKLPSFTGRPQYILEDPQPVAELV